MNNDAVKLVAKVKVHYGTRWLEPGEEFEATPMHARILVGIGKASVPESLDRVVKRKYKRRDMEADSEE